MMALLAGCGGGSGGDESTGTSISTNAISFRADGPDVATPAPQVFTATFGSDIAHLAVVHSGSAVSRVNSALSGRTATITVEPAAPSEVGPGAFVGAVAVTGYTCADATCSKLAAGTTSTVSVSYQISPVVQLVTPYVATAGVSDEVIIRGVGFRSFNVTGVQFGDVAATSASLGGTATEIRATHPALPAGTYTVRLLASGFQGDVTSTATLVVVDPTAYAAATLSYPTALSAVRRLIYDAERRALIVVTDVGGGSIVRYPYTGTTWGTPAEVAAGLVDAALSTKGTSLYGITPASLVPVDPVTLSLGTAVAAPSMTTGSFLKNIVVGNDDVALITTGLNAGTPGTNAYLYFPLSNAVVQTGNTFNNATPAMAANGSGAYLIQGDPSLTSDVLAVKYTTASTSPFTNAVTSLRQNAIAPVISRTANRFVLNGTRVYDTTEAFFGTLPATTAAVVLRPDGARAYTYDPTAGGILVFDTSVDRDEAEYPALGPAVPLAGDPGSNPQMIISPDGRTLFLAGSTQVVVQPTPAL
jgi:hypothetical protein